YFDVITEDSDCIIDEYSYQVTATKKGKYHDCSNGEKELIDFLGQYFSNTNVNNILLIDEPCTKLSSQNKSRLRDIIYKYNKKQIIMITHDSELIDINICRNIIHFSLNGHTTKRKYFKYIKREQNKLLFEYPKILFAK